MRKLRAGIIIGFATVLIVGCGGSSPKGFLDHSRLEDKLTEQTNTAIQNSNGDLQTDQGRLIPVGTTVTDTICIKSTESERKFECKLSLSNGDVDNVTILVSEDGQSFIPE